MANHGHHVPTKNIRTLRISALLITLYFVVELIIALVTGSLALFADAAHELSAAVAIVVSLIAVQLSVRRPTPQRTFGFLRVETIAAFINGLLLLGMSVYILVKGYERLTSPVEVPSLPMYIMAIGGIWLEIATLVIMYRGQKENLNIRGAYWHVIEAFLGSIAVIVAAIFISVANIFVADAWAGIIFAFVLIYAAYGIIRDSVNILLDTTPRDIDLSAIEGDLRDIKGVIDTHHFHARAITESVRTFSGHLVIESFNDAGRILKQSKEILDNKYKFALSTVQLETEGLAESDMGELEYRRTS